MSPWWDDISASGECLFTIQDVAFPADLGYSIAKDLITHLLTVDPEKRYTIDEFLAHPWIRNAPESAMAARVPFKQTVEGRTERLNVQGIPGQAPVPMPLDSPLLAGFRGEGRAQNMMKSPGINVLKEAFDVSYAVHRMEEEASRRRAYNGPGGAGQAGFLQGLNEEDEGDDLEDARRIVGVAQAKEQQQQGHGGHVPQGRGVQQYAGAVGVNKAQPAAPTSLYDGRAGPRDHTKRGPFELNMDGATLLGRRGKHPVISPNDPVPSLPRVP